MARRSKIQLRRGTNSQWNSVNPILAEGEPAYSTDESALKLGDGISRWNELSAIKSYEVGDLMLATGSYTSGSVEGGVIRRATSLIFPWTYTQTNEPTDTAIGTAIHVDWNATFNDTDSGFGPRAQTSGFGPRPVFNLEGLVRYGANQTPLFNLEPLGYGDLLRVANVAGSNRNLVPAWSFMSSRMIVADNGKVTTLRNDVNNGGASFVDTKAYITINGGEIDGTTGTGTEIVTVLSYPFMIGDVAVSKRVAFDVHDIGRGDSDYGAVELRDALMGLGGILGDLDEDTSTVDENVGLRIAYLENGTRNIGIINASATVETPVACDLALASDTIPIDTTTVHLNNTSGGSLTLTATPILPAGVEGQRITLVNVSSDDIILPSDGEITDCGLLLQGDNSVVLPSGGTVELTYVADTTLKWVQTSQSNVSKLYLRNHDYRLHLNTTTNSSSIAAERVGDTWGRAAIFDIPALGMTGFGLGPGGASIWDVLLRRHSTGGLSINKPITLIETSTPAAPSANEVTLFARDNGAGKTQVCVIYSSGDVDVLSTQP